MALGLDPVLFWDLTPREIATIGGGRQERLRLDFNDMMTTAYWGGLIAHLKDAPRLSELLLKPKPSSSPKQSWQAIKAALQVALPPTEDDKNGR